MFEPPDIPDLLYHRCEGQHTPGNRCGSRGVWLVRIKDGLQWRCHRHASGVPLIDRRRQYNDDRYLEGT